MHSVSSGGVNRIGPACIRSDKLPAIFPGHCWSLPLIEGEVQRSLLRRCKMLLFILGLIIGANIGFLFVALCQITKPERDGRHRNIGASTH